VSKLAHLLGERQLRRLAGERSFERGADYFAAGRVTRLARSGEHVEANVRGARRYRVELWVADGELASSCTCPVGEGGAFCKHCVAVGLALPEAAAADDGGTVTLDDVRDHIASLPGEELVELVIEEAREDERLLDRLRLRAAAGTDAVNLAAFRDAIDHAVDPGGFVPYSEVYDYSRTVDGAIDSLQALLDRGHAAEAIELVEYCCSAIERIGGMVDDSDGHLGIALDRLQRLHREACDRAEIAPVELAERLFERMLTSDYELFFDAIKNYAPLLGTAGRRRYAELAQSEWERLPPLRPGDGEDSRDRAGRVLITPDDLEERHRRHRITHVMELLAEQTGDVDELVAVISHDLSLPYSFLRIAEAYLQAGREDDAIEWAERGMEAFPERPDSRLVTFLADAYGRRVQHARAAELMWALFEDHPGLASYRDMRPYAERAGEWGETRERALDLLRERVAAAEPERRQRGYGWSPYRDASELVWIHLWEGDVEAALAAARANGCSQDAWLTLAERLRDPQPREALVIYREQVEPTINRKTNADYRHAVELLSTVRELMARTGRADEFPGCLQEVRDAHRRKRNLMKLIDDLESGGS